MGGEGEPSRDINCMGSAQDVIKQSFETLVALDGVNSKISGSKQLRMRRFSLDVMQGPVTSLMTREDRLETHSIYLPD